MTPSLDQLIAQVNRLSGELEKRCTHFQLLDRYYDGAAPMPLAITEAGVTKAYRRLMPVADAPWGSLIVGSVLDRLEVGGIRDKDSSVADDVWDIWQANHMDSESALAHESGLISGRAFATVWPNLQTGQPEISLDSSEQMIVQYVEGSRHKRQAALRQWQDATTNARMATLYRPDGIYKFEETKPEHGTPRWDRRQEPDDETWPVPNPFGTVPVVEIRFNPRLKSGEWGYARGEYEHCRGLIDRINLLTFIGLVVAFWQGFPVRGVVGDRILRDDDGNVIPPFDVRADTVAQLENPKAKFVEFSATDRNNLSIFPELAQLAAITKTPRHYFPLATPNVNISADAIRADEGALNAKVKYHKLSAGEGWEEVLRLCAQQADLELSPNAEIVWIDRESRSLAERADAATKLQGIMPWQALAEEVLLASQDTIARWEAMRASDTLSKLLTAARQPAAGNGVTGPTGTLEPDETAAPTQG